MTNFLHFWIDLGEPQNQPFELTFFYSGDVLRRYGNYVYLWDATGWYPRMGYRNYANFTLNYTIPNDHFFASIGEMINIFQKG